MQRVCVCAARLPEHQTRPLCLPHRMMKSQVKSPTVMTSPQTSKTHTHTNTHIYTHTHTRPPTGTSLEEAETVELCQEERSWASCASVRRLQEIGCVCVCVSGRYLVLGFLQIAAGPQREPQTVSDLGLVLPTAQLLRETQTWVTKHTGLQINAFQEQFSINTSHENDHLLIYSTCFNTFIAFSLCFFTLRQYRSQI